MNKAFYNRHSQDFWWFRPLVLILLIVVWASNGLLAQKVVNLSALKPKPSAEQVIRQILHNDSTSTTTVLWIKDEVRPHYHAHHDEQVIILEGSAQMLFDNQILNVKANEMIFIPRGTIHAVRVTSKDKVLKVLSIHTPSFDGTDRVQVEKAGW